MKEKFFNLLGITREQFEDWCLRHNLKPTDKLSRTLFVDKIIKKQVILDSKSNKILDKGE